MSDIDELRDWLATGPVERSSVGWDLHAVADALALESEDLLNEFKSFSGYREEHIRALWADQETYLENADVALKVQHQTDGSRPREQVVRNKPHGRVLACLPSNAPIPLAAVLLATGVALGNRVVLTRPKITADLVDSIVRIALNASPTDAACVFTGSPRTLMGSALEDVDFVYFMGASAAYPNVAGACATAGSGLIFEGQGNGYAYVGEDSDVDLAVRSLLQAKAFCNGRMCSAPNALLVHSAVFDAFAAKWSEEAPAYALPAGGMGGVSDEVREWSINAKVDPATVLEPTLVVVSDAAALPQCEFFSPLCAALPVESFDDALSVVRGSKFRLQVSYFGGSEYELGRLSDLPFCRIVVNQDPSDQDPMAPWGNYGMSGHSPLATFREKLVQRQLVEGSLVTS